MCGKVQKSYDYYCIKNEAGLFIVCGEKSFHMLAFPRLSGVKKKKRIVSEKRHMLRVEVKKTRQTEEEVAR